MPALLTSTSTRPNSLMAALARAVQSSGLVTSARTARPRRPSASTRARVFARRSSRRAPSTTSAPAWARACANWTPSPLDAPVTIATRPSRRKLSSTGVIRSPFHGHSRDHPFYVLARCSAKRWIGVVAEARRGRLLVGGALPDPVVPVPPPAAGDLARAREPLVGTGVRDRSGAVAGPPAARSLGYHNRVAALGEDEHRVAPGHGGGPVAVPPR